MIAKLGALRTDLGTTGVLALIALAACAGFHIAFIRPMEGESVRLDAALASQPKARPRAPGDIPSLDAPGVRAATFYEFLGSDERMEESLGRLYGIASAAGLELRSADYRLAESKTRLQRYEISLPIQGTYAQLRLFLETALRELPSLSLDRVTLRRKNAGETRIDAELVLTLHRLRR